MIHFSSDLHFYHDRLKQLRGFDTIEQMNQALIDNWNRQVKPTDTIYHLGDFSFANLEKTKEILKKLNGTKHFILGNHDKIIVKNQDELLKSGLIETIQHYKELKYEKQFYVLFHFSMRTWHRNHYGAIHLWGHSHNSLPPFGKSVDIGVDSTAITNELRPVSIEEVNLFMKDREIAVVDHHKPKDQNP